MLQPVKQRFKSLLLTGFLSQAVCFCCVLRFGFNPPDTQITAVFPGDEISINIIKEIKINANSPRLGRQFVGAISRAE